MTIPLKVADIGGGNAELAEWEAGDVLPVALGGTGATTAAAARANLGAAPTSLPVFTGLREVRAVVAASTIDLAIGNLFTKTLVGNTTFAVSNVPISGTVVSFILELVNGGNYTVGYWAGVRWASGTAPALTAGGKDVLGFYSYDGGLTWVGLLLAKDVR